MRRGDGVDDNDAAIGRLNGMEIDRVVVADKPFVIADRDTRRDGPTVGIVGGGIAGLATAWRLTVAGCRVTIFEAGASLGGLGDSFDHGGHPLERFYHCMLPTDRHLLALLGEIGLGEAPVWRETSFGILTEGGLYPLNTPADLLRFAPLSIADRARIGMTGVWGRLRRSQGLDEMTCEAWLSGLSGRSAFERFWRPMLEAKFGDRYHDVPALWFWSRFNREKGGKVECKGYPRGGYRRIIDRLTTLLRARGATIRLREPVRSLSLARDGRPQLGLSGGTARFDQVVYAGPNALLPGLADLVSLGVTPSDLGSHIDMQGVINVVLLLRRSLTPHYWVATVDADVPFHGVVETTTLIDPGSIGGAHLVYLTRYLHRDEPGFGDSDANVFRRYWRALKGLFPDLSEADLIASHVFRSSHVEPIYQLGYQRRKPKVVLVPGRVYLATTAQVYPDVTSWNGSCRLAESVAMRALADAVACEVGGSQERAPAAI